MDEPTTFEIIVDKQTFDHISESLDRADEDFHHAAACPLNGYEPEDVAAYVRDHEAAVAALAEAGKSAQAGAVHSEATSSFASMLFDTDGPEWSMAMLDTIADVLRILGY